MVRLRLWVTNGLFFCMQVTSLIQKSCGKAFWEVLFLLRWGFVPFVIDGLTRHFVNRPINLSSPHPAQLTKLWRWLGQEMLRYMVWLRSHGHPFYMLPPSMFCPINSSGNNSKIVQVPFALGSASVFSRTDTTTDLEQFYDSILQVLKDANEQEEVQNLLTWWKWVSLHGTTQNWKLLSMLANRHIFWTTFQDIVLWKRILHCQRFERSGQNLRQL